MPKRTLAGRCQKAAPKDNDDVFVDPPRNFDFDFRNGQAVFAQPPSPERRKPGISEVNETANERPYTTPGPQSSTCNGSAVAVDRRLQLAKVEDNWIGVAFGSPTHPPSGWTDDTEPASIGFPRIEGQLPCQTPSKWKKIGGIFRAKSPAQVQPQHNYMHDDFDAEQYKLGIPLRRVPWRNPRSPPAFPVIERQSIDTINSPNLETTIVSIESPTEVLPTSKELPKLDIEIPSTEMERYSIMFRHINGVPSPSLSVGKSNTAEDPRALRVEEKSELSLLQSSVPQKLTTNTPTKMPYSLFPSPPKTRVFDYLPNAKATEALLHVRSASAPATLSPCRDNHRYGKPCKAETKPNLEDRNRTILRRASITEGEMLQPTTYNAGTSGKIVTRPRLTLEVDNTRPVEVINIEKYVRRAADTIHHNPRAEFEQADSDFEQTELDKPLPLRPRRGPSAGIPISPDDNVITSDIEDALWGSKESLKSSASSQTSIEDEIFFGIKSFRGSKEQNLSQFEISRPDSSAVKHARSMSRKVKIQRHEQMPLCHETETQEVSFCMPPDLQAAEHCCTASEPEVVGHGVRLSMFDKVIAEVERFAPSPEAVSPLTERECGLSITTREHRPAKPILNMPTRLQSYPIAIPSPIVERSEESAPVSALGKGPVRHIRHIASQTSQSSSSSPQNFSSSIWDVPPPVPKKDTKFLPVSKYSIHHTSANLTESTSYRARMPSKSIMEHPAHTKQPSSRKPERSASFSVRTAARQGSRASPVRRSSDKNFVTVAIRPTAECSVARTISLRRKTSHQVLVSRSTSRRNDHAQQSDDEEKLHWSTNERAMSPVIVLDVPKSHKPGASVNLVVESV